MPVKKVMVTLAPVQGDSAGDGGQQQYAVVTDPQGHFQIEGVQPGDYRVTLARDGFVAGNHRSRAESRTSLSVAAGQDITGLLFRMLPAGVIQGRIVDEDGDPVPRVNVFAFSPAGSVGPTNATTNDRGEYRISGLSSGEYFVVAQTERPPVMATNKSDEPKVYAPTFYPSTRDKHQATKLEVHPGDEAAVNFSLVSTRTFKVRGSLSDFVDVKPQGPQSETAMVTLEAVDNWMTPRFEGPVLPGGTFEITGVFPGSYRASITAPAGPQWHVLRAGQTVEVRDADVDGLQLSPEPPSEIHGRFRMDTDNNQTPNWSQLNIQIDPDERDVSGGQSVGRVAKDGSFNLENVPSGNYHVVVTSNSNGESWRDFIVKEVVLNGTDVGDSGFSLAGGITSLEIVASAQGSTIEGNVVDEDGKPVPNIPVGCIPDASRRKRRDIYQQVQTDRQGHFALRGLNSGEYQVFTLDDPADDISDPDFVTERQALGQSVQLDAGERKAIVLKLPAESQP